MRGGTFGGGPFFFYFYIPTAVLACADMCKTSVERGSAAGFLLTQLSPTLGWPVLMEGSPVPVPSHGTKPGICSRKWAFTGFLLDLISLMESSMRTGLVSYLCLCLSSQHELGLLQFL